MVPLLNYCFIRKLLLWLYFSALFFLFMFCKVFPIETLLISLFLLFTFLKIIIQTTFIIYLHLIFLILVFNNLHHIIINFDKTVAKEYVMLLFIFFTIILSNKKWRIFITLQSTFSLRFEITWLGWPMTVHALTWVVFFCWACYCATSTLNL